MANSRRRPVKAAPRPTRRRRGELVDGVYRSQYEAGVARALDKTGHVFGYEAQTYPLEVTATRGHRCTDCGLKNILRKTRYTPDFHIDRRGVPLIVETKGKFTGRDRRIALAFREQYPDVDYRLCFQRDNLLSKASKTRYTEWCRKHEIVCHVGPTVPSTWL